MRVVRAIFDVLESAIPELSEFRFFQLKKVI